MQTFNAEDFNIVDESVAYEYREMRGERMLKKIIFRSYIPKAPRTFTELEYLMDDGIDLISVYPSAAFSNCLIEYNSREETYKIRRKLSLKLPHIRDIYIKVGN